MSKKRLRNHTNPLNFRQSLTDMAHLVPMVNGVDAFKQLDLEIGFGRGKFMRQYVMRHPDRFVVGVEVRKQIVELFKEKPQLPNLLPVWGTGAICLTDMIPDASLSRVFIFHPDPWFKARHAKRRVLNADLLALLHKKMRVDGRVYVSTDVELLYNEMAEVCHACPLFERIDSDDFWTTDYQTHWSMFSEQDERSQWMITLKYKEST